VTLTWTPRERRFGFLHALGLTGLTGLLVARFVPVARLPIWHCVFREHTGWPCPGCGLTRAVDGLVHGRFGFAFASNPLGALAGCLFAVAAVVAVAQYAFRLSLPMPVPSPQEARIGRMALGLALVANYAFVIVQTRAGLR
jgi:hypothetical protein